MRILGFTLLKDYEMPKRFRRKFIEDSGIPREHRKKVIEHGFPEALNQKYWWKTTHKLYFTKATAKLCPQLSRIFRHYLRQLGYRLCRAEKARGRALE